jgi:15-cis-phytoene synthase
VTEGFIKLFEMLASIAEENYQEALNQIHLFPKTTGLPLGLSIVLYRGILDGARKAHYDVFHQRIVLSDIEQKRLIYEYQQSTLGAKS